jgi:hypothetical protein
MFSAGHVHAAPGDATRLEYARSAQAAACPDRSALQAQVSKRLGYDPFFPAARQTISVEIIDADGELRAHMRLMDENGIIVGSRELHEQADHCDELVASLALAISIALDPSAALGEQPTVVVPAERAPAPPADPAPEAEPEPVAPEHPPTKESAPTQVPESSAGARVPLRLAARTGFFGALGTAPALAFGLRLGLDLQRRRFRFASEFSLQLPASKALASGGSAQTSLIGGTFAPCLASDTFAGCGLLSLGSLQASE